MANLDTGYLYGPRSIRSYPVKSGVTIAANDFVDLDASGYLQPCDAGDIPFGVAVGAVTTAPTANGAQICDVDTSNQSVYRVAPDTGTVALTLVGKKMDTGGAQSANIDASTDGCLFVRGVDLADNRVLVSLILLPVGV